MPSLTKKIIRGKPYYYLRECQRVEGKPKIVSTIYLGPPQSILDRLMRPEPAQLAIYEFGASAAVWDMAQAIDLLATIDRHVPKRASQGPSVGQYLLMAAFNRCIAPCSKAQIADWYQKTALRRLLPLSSGQLTSQRFWDNMARIGGKHITAIEQDITSTVVSRFGLDLHCLLFDATNFFTFLDSFNARAKLPQRGHSKEGRDNLRILGLALLVTSDGEIPLFHHTYAGNQHDSVTFQSVAEELLERCRSLAQGACDITLVFDKGNNSAENLEWVGNSPFHFVGSLVPTQHKDLLRISRKAMRRLDRSCLRFGPTGPAKWSSESSAPSSAPSTKSSSTPRRRPFPARSPSANGDYRNSGHAWKIAETIPQGKRPPSRGFRTRCRRFCEAATWRICLPLRCARIARACRDSLSAFGIRPISISARPCWARPCSSPTEPTGPMSRSFLPTAPNTTSKPTFDV